MQSRTTRQFWRLFSQLPVDVQRDAQRAYRLFQDNPAHPGLHFKKLEGEDDDIYSARIGLDYRALAVMRKDRVVWYWIGSHADYDRLI
jgi:plasmid maintenance system killer protein